MSGCFLYFCCVFPCLLQKIHFLQGLALAAVAWISSRSGASILGFGGHDPQILGRGRRRVAGGSWTGRDILLCLIMYRKYFRKW